MLRLGRSKDLRPFPYNQAEREKIMVRGDNTKSTYFILGLILVAGFLLRIYKLSSQSIWLDEAYSIYHSQQNFMHVVSFKDLSPPLYYILLHFWIRLTGTSEFSVRLLSE